MKSAIEKSEEAYAALDESSRMVEELVEATDTLEQVERLLAALKSDVSAFIELSVKPFPPSTLRALQALEARHEELL